MDLMKMDHGSRNGRKCCVEGCPKRFNSMYRFPRSDPELFKVWLEKVKPPFYTTMTVEEIYRKYSVCEDHFPVECKVPGAKRGLSKTAVPSLNIPEPSSELRRSWNSSKVYKKDIIVNGSNKNSYQSMCRVCLERSTKLYPLQGPIVNCDVELCYMINFCIGEEVDLSEDLPQNVCIACFKTTRICYNFIQQYKTNQQTLINERLDRIKFEQQNTEYSQHETVNVDKSIGEHYFKENLEENSDLTYHNDVVQIENDSTNNYEEKIQIKFENFNENDNQEEEVEEVITYEEVSDEETILLDIIKQDNVEIEEEEAPDLGKFSHQEQTEDEIVISSVVIKNSKHQKEDKLKITRDQHISPTSFGIEVNNDVDVQPDSTSENVFKNDHNYVGTPERATKGVKRTEISESTLTQVPKFIPILPKVPSVQKILITPIISANPQVAPKQLGILPLNSNVQWLPIKSNTLALSNNSFNTNYVQKNPQNVIPKRIFVKNEPINAKSNVMRPLVGAQKNQKFIKKRIIVKKSKQSVILADNSQDVNSDDSSQQTSSDGSRKVVLKYPCPKCPNVVFISRESKFREHILGFHQNELLDCNKCPLGDLDAKLFLEHFLTSHRFECPKCQKTFRNKHNLVTHLRRHLNIRHFCTYPDCKKSFAMPFALKKHLEEHTGQVEYPCKICGHISTTYDTHNYHVRMHAGRKFLCTQCGQTFLQASHLKAHMWKHTGKKYFKCNQCNNSYTSVGPLRKHQRKYHST